MRADKYSRFASRSHSVSPEPATGAGTPSPLRFFPVFCLLVVASLGVIAADLHDGFEWLSGFMGRIANPVVVAFDRTLQPISSSFSYVTETLSAREENRVLKEEIMELKRENLALQDAAIENNRLRELLNLKAVVAPSALAVPVGRYVDLPGRRLMVLRAGEDQGLELGQPVLSESNQLLGRIIETSPSSATVRLLSDPVSKVRVTVQRTGAQGTLYSHGGNLYIRLERSESVQEKDRVVTSHLSYTYPEGLAVGEISRRASNSESDPMIAVEMGLMKSYAVKTVVPISEWRSFREVLCLPGARQTVFEKRVDD